MYYYLFMLVLSWCAICAPATNGNLTVVVANIKSARGTVRAAMYTDPGDFLQDSPNNLTRSQAIEHTGKVLFLFEALACGDYVVAVYHDLNDNEELDTNFLGIPTEPYAFSNNPKLLFRGPRYEDAVFTFCRENGEIVIELTD